MKQTFNILKQLVWSSVFLAFLGCSSDDGSGEGGAGGDALTSGKWYYEATNGVEGDECDKLTNIEFTPDGKYLLEAYAHSPSGTDCYYVNLEMNYTVSGNTLTVTSGSMPEGEGASTFSISNGILSITGQDPSTGEESTTTYDKTAG